MFLTLLWGYETGKVVIAVTLTAAFVGGVICGTRNNKCGAIKIAKKYLPAKRTIKL